MSQRLTHALDQGVMDAIVGPVLVIGARDAFVVADLPAEGLQFQQGDFMGHAMLGAAGLHVAPQCQGVFQAAVVYAARNREQTFGMLAQAIAQVEPGGLVLLDGAKTDGIDAMMRAIAAAGLSPENHVKAHGRLVWFTRPEIVPEVVADWAQSAALSRNTTGFLTAPGMFSHASADAGSQLLLEHLATDLAGTVADFGAGWGYIAADVLARNPGITTLHVIESDHAALRAAQANITDPRAQFHWVDATRPTGLKNLNTVVMNPPFHRHGATDPDLGRAFIAAAAAHLAPSGRLIMVANRQLPYEAVLTQLFAQVETLAQTGVYKVISASRPKRRVG